MKTAFIIHGTGGAPEGNWFQSVGEKLMEMGYIVIVPRFPTPEWQSLESWTEKFEQYKKHINEDTIFIAHSAGPAFVLSILETLDTPVKGCFFVSGFLGLIGNPWFDDLNLSITVKEFDWESIYKNGKYFYMCHGDDDPYVPLHNVHMLAENLWVDVDMIDWGGHLNSESGYTSFPYLLSIIQSYVRA